MRSSQWLPSANGQLFKPSDLYLSTDLTHRLLSGKVNFLHHRITNKDFISTLGVQADITFENFIKAFSKWITETTFSTSREHVFNIYEYFMEQYKYHPKEIKSLLDLPFIYLPSIWTSNGTIEGQFHKVDSVSWRDPSEVFKKISDVSMRKILRDFYPDKFKEFFIGTVGVDEYPSREEYLRLITNITSVTSLPNRGKCFEIFMLMAVLGETFLNTHALDMINEIDYPQNTAQKYKLYEDLGEYYVPDSPIQAKKAAINDKPIFPTVGNFFVSLDGEPILVINQDLAKVYRKNHSTVPMIFVDTVYEILQEGQKRRLVADSLFLKVLLFFKVCQLSTLKELYLEPEVITEQMSRGCVMWENLLHDITPITQRYISSLLPDIHKEMQTKIIMSDKDSECKFSDYLSNSKFFTVQKLQVIYRLKGRKDVNITREKVCNVESCGNKALIYINKAAVNAKDHYEGILLELLRLFLQDEEQRERLHEFIMMYSIIPDKDRYLQRKKVKDIYDGEIWNYPEPITEEASKPVPVSKDQPKPILTVTSGEKGLASWPPQNSRRGPGIIAKPESVQEDKRKILGKLQPHVAFSNITQVATDMDIVTEKPTADLRVIKDSLTAQGTSNIQKNKFTEEVPQTTPQKVTKSNLGVSEISKVPGESETSLSGKRKLNSNFQTSTHDVAELELEITIPQSKKLLMEDMPVFTDSSNSSDKNADDKLKPDKGSEKSSTKRKHIFNPDNFMATPVDAEYEDLPIHLERDYADTFKDFSEKIDPNDFTRFLGNAGENIVYTYLCQQNKTRIKSGDLKIEWLNNDLEAGEPYDIKISQSDGKIIYIEVKSTRSHSKKEFEISSQQVKFAFEQGSSFHLYRVSGLTSTSKVRIRRLVNLSMYLNNKSVRLYMVL